MAHELDMTTGQAAIAYVGQEPWHGLGQKLEEGASIETWTKAAGLDWAVNEAEVKFAISPGVVYSFPARKVLYRSDSATPLAVVSDGYQTVQPAEIMGFFNDLSLGTSAQLETAGSLQGGKVIWALARLGEDFSIMDDKVAPYLMLSTSYDMSIPTIAKLVATRVVCRNTIQLALSEKGAKQVRIPHSTKFDAQHARYELGIALDAFDEFKMRALKLSAQSFDMTAMDKFLLNLLQPTVGEIDGDQIRKSAAYKKITALFAGEQIGGSQDAVHNTAWGALNAVTEYIDHIKGRNQSARLQDAWFGVAASFKARALDLISK